ncbi:MAG TPA: Wzz/FepE/Etk N-terminal domain-containing protein, partial [Flavobacterium sp.]|nr:Wzz/FepE/Etk N-terminal domain-containing protein [Flavobacterium sp.]
MEKHSSLKETSEDNNISIRELIDQYLIHWKWFIIALVAALVCAFLYLRYTVPEYRTSAVIMVKDERKGGMQSEMTAFSDLGLMTGIKSNVDNEIEIIRSRTIVEKSVKKLNLNVSYYVEGRFKTVEVYKDKPIDIAFFDQKEAFYKSPLTFTIRSKSEDKFEIITASETNLGVFTYGNILRFDNFRMIVTKGALKKNYKKDFSIIVHVSTLRSTVQKYKGQIGIAPMGKNTSVVELTLVDPVREKAEDLLNTVIEIYNQDAIDDKNYISKKTQEFIAGRLEIIAAELGDVERDAEGFKRSNRLTDIVSDAGIYLQNSVDFEKALIETETQERIVSSMMDFMDTSKNETIPSNIIPNDNTASALIAEHNALIINRDRILKSGTLKNTVVINLNNEIEELR